MPTPMLLLLAAASAIGVFSVCWGLRRPAGDDVVQARLLAYQVGQPLTLNEIELQMPFTERFVRPAIERFGKMLARRTPQKSQQDLRNRLNLAGRPGNLSPGDFQAIRYVAGAALLVIGFALGITLVRSSLGAVLGGAAGVVTGLYLPVLWLKRKVDGRRRGIQLALPDAMDLLTVCVEAGLGFEAAIARVTEKFRNGLSDEFSQVLQETRLGRPRLEALDDMGRRCGVEDLHNFVQAVVQSEQMGVGVAKILRLQSDEIRRKRRQRASEKAAQASLKMLFPMVGCIFPTLWVVLLGPAILLVIAATHH
ncbi:MAG: type II secretion system F family protein [Candidatus Dormibacteraceae bacterium]